MAFEPRGEAWDDSTLRKLVDDLDLVHVVDPFHCQPVGRGLRYFRLHGRPAYHYHYRYSDADLHQLEQMLNKAWPNWVLFNNDAMVSDARAFCSGWAVAESMANRVYVGVDGCPAGWFYVALSDESEWTIGLVQALHMLPATLPQAQLILIDMPIGLRESGSEERACDRAARKVLGRARASSVFPVPVRPTLQAADYEEAKATNRRLTGKGITMQTWNIMPKLREVDELMQHADDTRHLMREAHPEVCFWALNGNCAMQHNKKTLQGRNEREALLYHYLPSLPDLLAHGASRYPRARLGWDDMLDAVVLALTARQGKSGLRTLPGDPELDAYGLPMEIVYCEGQQGSIQIA